MLSISQLCQQDTHPLRKASATELRGPTDQHEQDSPLLKLPGELRNKIYGYLLAQDRLVMKLANSPEEETPRFLGFPNHVSTQETNQLKYVCRLLRKETRGLGLKYTDTIAFRHETVSQVVKLAELFTVFCSPYVLPHIKRIELEIDNFPRNIDRDVRRFQTYVHHSPLYYFLQKTQNGANGLIPFCMNNPDLNFVLRTPDFLYMSAKQVDYAWRLKKDVGAILIDLATLYTINYEEIPTFMSPSGVQRISFTLNHYAQWNTSLPRNLRIWPDIYPNVWNKASFHDFAPRYRQCFKIDEEACYEQCREWIEEGL